MRVLIADTESQTISSAPILRHFYRPGLPSIAPPAILRPRLAIHHDAKLPVAGEEIPGEVDFGNDK
jgi:hypothetical protein